MAQRKPQYDGIASGNWTPPTLEDFLKSPRAPESAKDVKAFADAPDELKEWVLSHTVLESAGDFDEIPGFTVVDPVTGALNLEALRAHAVDSDDDNEERGRLEGVEIFRAGTWNGDKYTVKDIDDIVSAFDKVGFRPPVKLGHRENHGDPAFGWVASLKRVGDVLVADLEDIPKRLFQAIKDRRFDTVSSEIILNLKRNGKVFRRALKAVALLGSEIPAVSGLKPLRENFSVDTSFSDGVNVYSLTEEDIMVDKTQDKGGQDNGEILTQIGETLAKLSERMDSLEKSSALKTHTDATANKDSGDNGDGGGNKDASEQRKASGEKEGVAAFRLTEAEEQIKALQKQVEDANERDRQSRIESRVQACRVPALRDIVASLYDLATSSGERTVKFKTADGDGEPVVVNVEPVKVVDALVERVNRHTAKLFSEIGATGGFRRDDSPIDEDPGKELDRLTRKHMADHSVENYQQAFHAVLDDPDNADLKRAYGARRYS